MNRRRFFAAPAALLPLTAPNATLVASPARAHITLTFDQASLAKWTESVNESVWAEGERRLRDAFSDRMPPIVGPSIDNS